MLEDNVIELVYHPMYTKVIGWYSKGNWHWLSDMEWWLNEQTS